MVNLEKRIEKLEAAQPNIGPHLIIAIDGQDADENEDNKTIIERECRKRGITRQAFAASGGQFIRVVYV